MATLIGQCAIALYWWLAKHQVMDRRVVLSRTGGKYTGKVSNGVPIELSVAQAEVRSRPQRVSGLAICIDQVSNGIVVASVPDYGGIYDPKEGRVFGEHYATSHFAWASAMLYELTQDDEFLGRATAALEFVLNARNGYLFAEWGMHWDFDNLALVETYHRLRSFLPKPLRLRCEQTLTNLRISVRNQGTNWVAMRLLVDTLVSKHLRLGQYRMFRHRVVNAARFTRIRAAQLPDGCIEDIPRKSDPTQYHAYSAALLYRFYEESAHKSALRSFMKAAYYLRSFVDPFGEVNYRGRGQKQIFGYTTSLFCLIAAALHSRNEDEAESFADAASKVLGRIRLFQESNGSIPLILADNADDGFAGWYDYHHHTVYAAFACAWMLEAARIAREAERIGVPLATSRHVTQDDRTFPSAISSDRSNTLQSIRMSGSVCGDVPENLDTQGNLRQEFHRRLPIRCRVTRRGTVNLRSECFFISVSAGRTAYPSDAGLTLNHVSAAGIGDVISCPGGPSEEKYGLNRRMPAWRINFSCPIYRVGQTWVNPCGKRGVLWCAGNTVTVRLRYGNILVWRSIKLEKEMLSLRDYITIVKSFSSPEFRIVNLPILDRTLLKVGDELEIPGYELTVTMSGEEKRLPLDAKERFYGPAGLTQVLAYVLPQTRFIQGDRFEVIIKLARRPQEIKERGVHSASRIL